MTIQVGEKIPPVSLHHKTDEGVAEISTEEIFNGKKVVLFALPGAYTPTCSAAHLPGYVVKADELKDKGIDSIVCLSVNDAFVMGAWGEQHNVEDRVMMIADGSAHFTHAVGLELDLSNGGME
jgi:peroxiredoxin